jgi:hypothetical protein
VSPVALGPASLPGPGGKFAPSPANGEPALQASTEVAAAEHLPAVPEFQPPSPQQMPRWLVRAELFLRVMLRMYIGLFVCYAPWSHAFWDQNPIFLQFPAVGVIAVNGAVRGLVSGLGLLNLWIAFQDALRRGRD